MRLSRPRPDTSGKFRNRSEVPIVDLRVTKRKEKMMKKKGSWGDLQRFEALL